MNSVFHINTPIGEISAVIDSTKDSKVEPAEGDARQLVATRKLIAELAGLVPDGVNGCKVMAFGQFDSATGRSELNIQILPQPILLKKK